MKLLLSVLQRGLFACIMATLSLSSMQKDTTAICTACLSKLTNTINANKLHNQHSNSNEHSIKEWAQEQVTCNECFLPSKYSKQLDAELAKEILKKDGYHVLSFEEINIQQKCQRLLIKGFCFLTVLCGLCSQKFPTIEAYLRWATIILGLVLVHEGFTNNPHHVEKPLPTNGGNAK